MTWSLRNRIKTLLIAMLALVISVAGTVPFLASGFMPESESDKMLMLTIKMPRETTIETMNEKVKEIEKMMFESKDSAGQPTFDYVESSIGYNGGSDRIAYRSSFFAVASANSNAKDVVQDFKKNIEYLLPKGSEVDGSVLSMGGPPSGGADFNYVLKGDDLNYLREAAQLVRDKMKEFPEMIDIKDSLSESKQEIEISVDQNKARLFGLSSAQIMEGVHSWLAEEKKSAI